MEQQNIEHKGFVIQPRLPFHHKRDNMLYQMLVQDANFSPSECCMVGQTIISILSLEAELGWSRGQIRGMLKRLEDAGYISTKTLPQKKGTLITVVGYEQIQSLKTYKMNQQNNQQSDQQESQRDNQQDETEKPTPARGGGVLENTINQQNNQQSDQQESQQNNHTITAFKQHINNNKHIKDLRGNFSDVKHIELFVDLAEQINPLNLSRKVLIKYFDMLRLTRATCKISVNVCVNIWEQLAKFKKETDKLHYALLQHTINHDDKREKYTLGIIRNTEAAEARRKLLKLTNSQKVKEVLDNESSQASSRQCHTNELDQLSL